MGSASRRTPAPNTNPARLTLAALPAVAVFLGLSWNQGHYWDEYFYLYSVFAYAPAGSWIWHDPSLTLSARDQIGRYFVYEVSPRSQAARQHLR